MLQVKQKAVLAPVRKQVQFDEQAPEGVLGAFEIPRLSGGEQPCASDFLPVVTEPGRACHPEDHLQIAQAPGRFLAVGLQRIRGFLMAGMALLHFSALCLEKIACIQVVVHGLHEAAREHAASRDPAGFEQRRFDGDVAVGFLDALLDRAHAVARLNADIPHGGDQRAQAGFVLGRWLGWQQDQQIDVGVGVKLAPAIATDGGERGTFG